MSLNLIQDNYTRGLETLMFLKYLTRIATQCDFQNI